MRGRVYFDSHYNKNNTISLLKSLFGEYVNGIDKKTDREFGLDYTGITHIDLRIDGVNFELQVLPIEFRPYKEFLHRIYEMIRESNNKLSDKQKSYLVGMHNKLHNKIEELVEKNRAIN